MVHPASSMASTRINNCALQLHSTNGLTILLPPDQTQHDQCMPMPSYMVNMALYLYQTHINATFQQVNELLCKRLGILYRHLEQHDRLIFRWAPDVLMPHRHADAHNLCRHSVMMADVIFYSSQTTNPPPNSYYNEYKKLIRQKASTPMSTPTSTTAIPSQSNVHEPSLSIGPQQHHGASHANNCAFGLMHLCRSVQNCCSRRLSMVLWCNVG